MEFIEQNFFFTIGLIKKILILLLTRPEIIKLTSLIQILDKKKEDALQITSPEWLWEWALNWSSNRL